MDKKCNFSFSNDMFEKEIKKIINQVYKLLPTREEGNDWEKPLDTIIEEFAGIGRIFNLENDIDFLALACKMEGMYSLKSDENFSLYRRTIFDCLRLLDQLVNNYGI